MPRYLIPLGIIAVGIIIYSFIECLMTPRHQVRAMPKPVWAIIIVLVPLVGALLWLTLGRRRGSAVTGSSMGPTSGTPRPQSPDDDAAFLRQLDVQRAQQDRQRELDRREAELRAREAGQSPGGAAGTGRGGAAPEAGPESGDDRPEEPGEGTADGPTGHHRPDAGPDHR